MNRKKHDPKLWWILALLNVLMIEYPASVCMDADGDKRLAAALILGAIVLVLAIVDMFTIVGVLVE